VDTEYTIALRQQGASASLWRTISLVLGLIIAGGTVLSVAGKAFFVTRTEYTDKVTSDSVDKANLHYDVESIKSTLSTQETAFRAMVQKVDDLNIALARDSRRK
jgi:CHASE3 domain sensor protein